MTMSKKNYSNGRRERNTNASSEEEYEPSQSSSRKQHKRVSQSQLSQSQASQSGSTQQLLNETELHRLAALCANLFLVSNCKKIPIKRADIGRLVPKEYSRKVGEIIQVASLKLEKVFGYKVVEIEKKGNFLLVNLLNLAAIFEGTMPVSIQPHESAVIVLRTNILITIFMNNEVMTEGTLREFVKKFGIDVESKENHPLLGNVQKLVYQDFVRQGYLEIEHHKDIESPFKEIRWGSRAKEELDKKELLQFVCKIYGDTYKPEMWVEQWRSALKDSKDNENEA